MKIQNSETTHVPQLDKYRLIFVERITWGHEILLTSDFSMMSLSQLQTLIESKENTLAQ